MTKIKSVLFTLAVALCALVGINSRDIQRKTFTLK